MKAKILFSFIAILIFSISNFAQSVVITPKKVVYKRPKAEQDFKKSFTVIYPKVRAASVALSKKIEAEISYEKNNNLNLKQELGEYQWLEEASYQVNYNKNGLLAVTLSTSGSATYPSVFDKSVVVAVKTGRRIKPSDIFINLGGLANMVRKSQIAEIKKAREEYKKDPDTADFDANSYFDQAKITAKELEEFSISDNGITFIYSYGFPHVALALEPDGRYFFSWKQLKPFIKRGGLLAQFIR